MDDFSIGNIKLKTISVGSSVVGGCSKGVQGDGNQIFKSFSVNDLIKLRFWILLFINCSTNYFLLVYSKVIFFRLQSSPVNQVYKRQASEFPSHASCVMKTSCSSRISLGGVLQFLPIGNW